MSIFKNDNEVNYVGGRKHWTDVIKNTGAGDLLLWRQPEEDFNANSTLVVMPGEEAIFINGGVVQQVFSKEGTYKLDTNNYPFISRLRNAFSGGISTFNCVVYFIRKAHTVEIRWGTDSPIQIRDKVLGITTTIRARGSYKVKVEDSVLFLEKLVGNNCRSYGQQELEKYFISEFQSKIKSIISKALQESEDELLGIVSRLDEFSQILHPYMDMILSEYGLRCVKFTVVGLDIDDDALRRRYDEIGIDVYETERKSIADKFAAIQQAEGEKESKILNAEGDKQARILDAEASKETMEHLGNDWGKQKAAEILGTIAENPSAGGMAASGAGFGMGVSAAGVINTMARQMFEPMSNTNNEQRPFQTQVSGRFTQQGAESSSKQSAQRLETGHDSEKIDPVASLKALKAMLDEELITQEEYDAKKAEILSRM